MSTEEARPGAGATPPSSKRPYTQPRLVVYGDVRHLTQTGTQMGNENTDMTMNMDMVRAPSERRLKDNVVRVGTHPLGFGLYTFHYRPEFRDAYGYGRQFGVMADEVGPVVPEAVSVSEAGHMIVDYGRIGVRRDPQLA
jgi:hypothetical protein